MKAVIVEIKGSNVAVLSEDGCISQIKNRNYTIGQQISMKNNNYARWVVTAAATMVMFVTPAWAYLTPYSYVSLDVNPSFEFSINRFDRVLEVKAVNGDAEELVEEINIKGLKNKEIKDAVRNVLSELKNQGYITEGEEGGVVVATSSKSEEKTNDLATALKTAVDEEVSLKKENKESEKLEKSENKADDKDKDKSEQDEKSEEAEVEDIENEESGVEVKVVKVSQEKVNEAQKKGVTPGKMNLVDKLEEVANIKEFDEDEWLKKPVKDIMSETKKYEKAAKMEDKELKKEQSENLDEKYETDSNGNGNQGNSGKGSGESSSGNKNN